MHGPAEIGAGSNAIMKHREIRFVTLGLLVAAMMLLTERVGAAPAVDEAEMAKKTFATLKQKLPKLLEEWGYKANACEVKSARQIGATEAKVTIVFSSDDPSGKPKVTQVLVVFLQYYDKHWTTTRFENSIGNRGGGGAQLANELTLRLLMLAIDECTEQETKK
jgi:hypothetical protein